MLTVFFDYRGLVLVKLSIKKIIKRLCSIGFLQEAICFKLKVKQLLLFITIMRHITFLWLLTTFTSNIPFISFHNPFWQLPKLKKPLCYHCFDSIKEIKLVSNKILEVFRKSRIANYFKDFYNLLT